MDHRMTDPPENESKNFPAGAVGEAGEGKLEIPGTYPVGGVPLTSATARQLRDYVQFVLELARDGKRPSVADSNTAETALDMLADSCLALLHAPDTAGTQP